MNQASDLPTPGGFAELGLHPSLLAALAALGYEEPTPIQRAAVPPLLQGRDVLGQAATGTGKTAAFALPLIQRLTPGACQPFETSALVLVPTRELAMQVAEAIHSYGHTLGVRVLPVYGGQDIGVQLRRLKRGIDVVVATPGRALDHLRRGTLKLDRVGMAVLDEADEMLDMGFAEDLEALLAALPARLQIALFSATLPPHIAGIADRHLKAPVQVRIATEAPLTGETPRVRQTAYIVPRAYKDAALGRILDLEAPGRCLVFCRTRTEVDALTATLNGHGFRAEALHGGLSQEQRDRVMKLFKSHTAEVLVATDVAARGLDIEKLTHVVNYDPPSSPDAYLHRIGRTGRAGREGVAITLIEPREHRLLRNFERLVQQRIEVATVPTVADLKARRLELTRASLREALLAGGLDSYHVVVESLASEFNLLEIAAAGVKLLHAASGAAAEGPEIPVFTPPPERAKQPARPKGRPERAARVEREVGVRKGPKARAPGGKRPGVPAAQPALVFVGAGRRAGIRPADLVGAIVNEAGVEARRIGTIEISDAYSLVEVPQEAAEPVIQALRATTLRGRKVTVKRTRK